MVLHEVEELVAEQGDDPRLFVTACDAPALPRARLTVGEEASIVALPGIAQDVEAEALENNLLVSVVIVGGVRGVKRVVERKGCLLL